uniref:Uncharacterized protein n=1 Tax=Lactuca sativa TaxID=4236 RepID=A0A9R1UEL5_LACSA|nr:hypothetical protein LSAT_V11C900474420 [Lactuca sativa]
MKRDKRNPLHAYVLWVHMVLHIWLENVMKELIKHHIMPIILYVSNKFEIYLMKNIMFHVKYVNLNVQQAIIFTIDSTYIKHNEMKNMISVTNLEPSLVYEG